MKVVFPYLGQLHQVLHSLPIAAEMSIRHPDVKVHVAGFRTTHLEFVRRMIEEHSPGAPLQIDALKIPILRRLRIKNRKRAMIKNSGYLRSFDAIVTPERTSLFMRRLRLGATRLIWTRHGAGDRAVGFAPDVRDFDYVLMAGRKIEDRLLAEGLVQPGRYTSGIYAKLDWLRKKPLPPPMFDNGRRTVLYNPHFNPRLSSWPKLGRAILDFFAESSEYNLIFAPHVRLFDPPTRSDYRSFARYAALPHMHVDLGSERSIDMTYANAADLYLGDVSSQICEFVLRPRPALFINVSGIRWQGDANYRCWTLGPVIGNLDRFRASLDEAFASREDYVEVQKRYAGDTFGEVPDTSSAARAADAIVAYLRNGQ